MSNKTEAFIDIKNKLNSWNWPAIISSSGLLISLITIIILIKILLIDQVVVILKIK